MYKISLFLFGVLWLASCKKDNNDTRTDTALTIDSTKTPATGTLNTALTGRVRATGPNLCYRFERVKVDSTAPREWAVRVVGSVPSSQGGCAQTIYRVDTTVNFTPRVAGQNIVRFYNGSTLYKADTVQVN